MRIKSRDRRNCVYLALHAEGALLDARGFDEDLDRQMHVRTRRYPRTRTYAGSLSEPAERPFADVRRTVDAGAVGLLDERLADEVHGELLRLLDVLRRVLKSTIGELRDGDGDERRRLRDLVEQTGHGVGG